MEGTARVSAGGFVQATARCNLHRLMLLRNFIIIGLSFAIVMHAAGRLPVALSLTVLASVAGYLALFNLATYWRLGRAWRASDLELLGHIFSDILALAVLLYFSGGTASPFIGLLLVFVAIAGASLRWVYSVCVTLLTVGCYALLDTFHVPLSQSTGGVHDFQTAAFSLCINYAVGAALVAYFVSAIASLVRDQGRILAEARQREINHDYVVRVGFLVAGAAHEIRSSLSTMAIVVKDLLREGGNPTRDLHLISEQIEACRRSLSDLMVGHDVAEPDSGEREPVKVFLRGVLDRWETLRPGARVALRWRGAQPGPAIPADRCLGQAIINLLDNAADSAPDKEVEMNCRWSPQCLRILIQDRGPGLQQSVARAEPGQRLLTTKGEKGTGIGLLLAKTAIQRFGGSLKLSNRSGGGARAQVILPLRSVQVGATQTRPWEFHSEEKHAKPDERTAESAARG